MTSIVGGAAARQALDDRRILTSLGEVAYDWDILSDRLRWGPNAADVLPPATFDLPRTGRDWDGRVSAVATETRRDAV
ncbi:MAG TPA: GGDEF-domain containing protein, partial [Beijerinckiaceae bacterium]